MSVLAGVCRLVLLLFKTGLKHYLLASINDEYLGTKLNKILAPFGSRTGKIEDKIMKGSGRVRTIYPSRSCFCGVVFESCF